MTTPENTQILSQEEIEEIVAMPRERVTLILRSGKKVPVPLLAETIRELQRQLAIKDAPVGQPVPQVQTFSTTGMTPAGSGTFAVWPGICPICGQANDSQTGTLTQMPDGSWKTECHCPNQTQAASGTTEGGDK